MPITGSDKALSYSLVGVNRVGASRVGYYPPRLFVRTTSPGVTSDYADVSQTVRKSDIQLEQHLDGGNPDVLTLVVRSDTTAPFSAQPGAGIQLCTGTTAHPIFTGRILSVQQILRTATQRFPDWQIRAVDYSWELNFIRPSAARYQLSASTAAADFIATSCAGFEARVEGGLPDVDLTTSVMETCSEFLTRLTQAVGGYWFVDAQKRIYVYRTTPPASFTLDSDAKFWDLRYDDDVSQVRNRIYVVGGGGVTTQSYAAGDTPTELHLDDVGSWYTSLGGIVMIGQFLFVHFGFTDGADPTLDGFAIPGGGGLPIDIPIGTSVRVVALVNGSVGAVVNWFNGERPGSHHEIDHIIEDQRLDVDGATFRALAEEAQFNQSFTTITFKTRDPRFKPGTNISVALPGIAAFVDAGVGGVGEFLVQDMSIAGSVADSVFPVRTVTLGSFRRDLSSLMSRLGQVTGAPKGSQGI